MPVAIINRNEEQKAANILFVTAGFACASERERIVARRLLTGRFHCNHSEVDAFPRLKSRERGLQLLSRSVIDYEPRISRIDPDLSVKSAVKFTSRRYRSSASSRRRGSHPSLSPGL